MCCGPTVGRRPRRPRPASLRRPARSCVIQLADAAGSAPSATVSSNRAVAVAVGDEDPRDLGLQPQLVHVPGPPRPRELRQGSRGSPRSTPRPAPARGCRAPGSSGSRTPPPSSASSSWCPSPRPSAASPARAARPPRAPRSAARPRSTSARSSDRTEFMFLISTLVPSASVPAGRTETFASHRSDPSSIRTSETSSDSRSARSSRRYAAASSGRPHVGLRYALDQRDAGAVVVDQRVLGLVDPARRAAVRGLAGVLLHVHPRDARPACVDPSASSTSRCPPTHTGRSYWLI